ncbi:UDP-3-O-[3-hydroxymyristoyl] glucosamine N-acyltransferase [Ensifer adhaerens]|uniref:UDP-3-O-[3-hydroxymyristoyl] glucosamine N-acyltransferase n=1 Tax=Ensifer adhaerens TaxID=106592 RepID=A0ACC5SUD0_ENSAD|nr:DapH/DapD/GlmU-related protein [Ensifer adhaerens]MBP1872276.1 UDP-3-O-[3-hydroxymyristoyl] glucosamine N-acyltransferase [Ensifer adhaerens]
MKLSEIFRDGTVSVVRDAEVSGFAPLSLGGEGSLHYYADTRFVRQFASLTGRRNILTTAELQDAIPETHGLAVCENPREAFLRAYMIHGQAVEARAPFASRISPTAKIHPRAHISDTSVIIGDDVIVDANAVIHERVEIEDGVRIGAGSVIGGDGFEVGIIDGRQIVLPHYGRVLIRRGAVVKTNTSVDWGIYGGDTEIGANSVVDNLVHVAHNVRIGEGCQIIACCLLGGSAIIEDGARIGPNATISNGLRIGRGARVTLGAVVTRDVPDGGHVTGNFAVPHERFLEQLRQSR